MAIDRGDVHFGVDLSTGLVTVTVRPALGLESAKTSADTTVYDVLDVAGQILTAMNAQRKQALGQLTTSARPQ